MKALMLLALLAATTGCGTVQRAWVGLTGGSTEKCSRTGVVYLQSDSGFAVLLDKDGKPVTCTP